MRLDLKPSIKWAPLRVTKRSTAETQKHKTEAWEIKDWRGKLWRVAKRSATETQKHKTEAWEIEDWRGKLWRGATGVISIPSNDSTFITMMKRE
jgi:hypothetical protein